MVYEAAEQTLGEVGTSFLRKAHPSAELWSGKAGTGKGLPQLCGSRVEGGHMLHSRCCWGQNGSMKRATS